MSEVIIPGDMPPVPVFLHEGRATTTSHDVAEFFGKRHDHVLERIRTLECSHEFRLRNFAEIEYTDARNRPQRMYRMSRDGFTFLAMGFTGARAAQFKEGFIAAFNALESSLTGGAALPELARSVAALVAQQDLMERKVDAILDLVDVTKRYVQLLESNQKPARRTEPYAKITPALQAEVLQQLNQGFSMRDVGRAVNLPPSAVHRIKTTAAQAAVTEPAP